VDASIPQMDMVKIWVSPIGGERFYDTIDFAFEGGS
jgi:hypothetical protein